MYMVEQCAVPENIHTPPTEGIFLGVGDSKTKKFKEMYED